MQKLNPNQIPVVAADQPLYALLKSIQWKYEIYNEQRVVIMLGGLHTEMCAWSVLGKLLDHSGWVDALTEAEVTTPGRAQAIVHASHLKRTRYMHEISAVVFSKLKNQAFVESGTDCDFEEWSAQQCTESPTFFSGISFFESRRQYLCMCVQYVNEISTSTSAAWKNLHLCFLH